MTVKAKQLGAISTVLAFALCQVAVGQVVKKDTGREMDSNLRLGSGGVNVPVGGSGRFDSQLLINRQSTGLSSFRAGVPYKAANQLRLELPSARLGDFRRQSIGVGQVLAGETIRISPYFERTSTTVSIRAIGQGMNLPGSTVPRTSYPSAASVVGVRRLDYRTPYKRPVVSQGRLLSVTPTSGIQFRPVTGMRVSQRELFGPPAFMLVDPERLKEQKQLAKKLARQLAEPSARVDARMETRIDAAMAEPIALPGKLSATPQLLAPHEPSAAEPNAPMERPMIVPPVEQPPQGMPRPTSKDVYVDLLRSLYDQRRAELAWQVPPATPASPDREPGSAVQLEGASENRLAPAPIGRPVVIYGLAGTNHDLFNRRMTRAQERFNRGKFFDAGSDYEFAAILNRTNPLPRIGAGLARFATGEFLSAGLAIRHALKVQPAIMRVRFDLPSILPTDVIDRQIASIEARLAQGEADARLALTAAFVHQNLAHVAEARAAATKLREYAGDDKILTAYADYILSNGRATTAPAMKFIPATIPAK